MQLTSQTFLPFCAFGPVLGGGLPVSVNASPDSALPGDTAPDAAALPAEAADEAVAGGALEAGVLEELDEHPEMIKPRVTTSAVVATGARRRRTPARGGYSTGTSCSRDGRGFWEKLSVVAESAAPGVLPGAGRQLLLMAHSPNRDPS